MEISVLATLTLENLVFRRRKFWHCNVWLIHGVQNNYEWSGLKFRNLGFETFVVRERKKENWNNIWLQKVWLHVAIFVWIKIFQVWGIKLQSQKIKKLQVIRICQVTKHLAIIWHMTLPLLSISLVEIQISHFGGKLWVAWVIEFRYGLQIRKPQ